MQINVKYLDPEMPPLEAVDKGDWIDARAVHVQVNGEKINWELNKMSARDEIKFSSMDRVKVGLGLAMHFPPVYEAHIRPRSSLFKRHGLLMTNGLGVIDHTYCGNTDEWFAEFFAVYDGFISRFERLCQWRLIERMPRPEFVSVQDLGNPSRGGHGSTGRDMYIEAQEDDGFQ